MAKAARKRQSLGRGLKDLKRRRPVQTPKLLKLTEKEQVIGTSESPNQIQIDGPRVDSPFVDQAVKQVFVVDGPTGRAMANRLAERTERLGMQGQVGQSPLQRTSTPAEGLPAEVAAADVAQRAELVSLELKQYEGLREQLRTCDPRASKFAPLTIECHHAAQRLLAAHKDLVAVMEAR